MKYDQLLFVGFFLILVMALLLLNCEHDVDEPGFPKVLTIDVVQDRVFVSCSPCHIGQTFANLNLSSGQSFDNIVNVPSLQKPDIMRIQPYQPDNSYLYMKVVGTEGIDGDSMPAGGQLSNDQVDILRQWIVEGALNTNGSEPSDTTIRTIVLDTNVLSLEVGDTAQLIATAYNSEETIIETIFEWDSTNEQVALVDVNGMVTAIAEGETEIMARADTISSNSCLVQVTAAATLTQIQTNIFDVYCVGCHGTSGGLDLSAEVAYDNLINIQANGNVSYIRVEPTNPNDSYLYMKVVGDDRAGSQMPIGSELTEAEINMIFEWITAGALNN